MSNAKPNLMKGLLAGIAAGLVATAAKAVAEKFFPAHTHEESVVTTGIGEHALVLSGKPNASQAINWGFGALAGGAYGMIAEVYPAATARNGAQFGAVLATLTETSLPTLGIGSEPEEKDEEGGLREEASSVVTHVVFGVVAETVRTVVRKAL